MTKNTNAPLEKLISTQANFILGSIISGLPDYNADSNILKEVMSDKKVKDDIIRLEDYLEYYDINNAANFHEITMALRIGLRIGAYYMIKDFYRL